MEMREELQYWTADEIAECIPYGQAKFPGLYEKLWGFMAAANNSTPQGGDGSDGTVEDIRQRLGDFDDQTPAWWSKLTQREQKGINDAYESVLSIYG